MRVRVLIGAFVVLIKSVIAQTEFHRTAVPITDSSLAALRFERNVNTYFWNANAAYLYDDSDLLFRMKEKFTSSFIRGQNGSFRDEQHVSVNMSKHLNGPYSAAFELQSFILSDRQSFGNSNAGIHSAAAGIIVQPSKYFSFTPMAGVRYDQEQLYKDDGWNLRLYTRGDSLDAGDYRTAFSGQLNESDLGRRRFKSNAANVKIETEFSEGSTDSIRIRWTLNRNDFYIPADSNVLNEFGTSSNIRLRTEQQWGVQNTLAYQIGSGLVTMFDVEIESRSIANAYMLKPLSVLSSIPFNTAVQEFHIEGGWILEYGGSTTLASLGFFMGERNEKHLLERISGIDEQFQNIRSRQESRLNNVANRNSLRTALATALSPSDEMFFSGSVGILKYDTPDTINTDDRDELLVNLSLRESHRFSNNFTASLTAEATIAHLVYISREKSANNNWNRIYRLKPEIIYQPTVHFKMFNAFEVQANYTVFDFESIVPSVKSYSYRQVAFLDSTSYDMTKRVGFDVMAYVRVYERGELRWEEFSERPLQRIEEVTFSPQVRYSPSEQWAFAAGFRSFAQKRFKYANTIRQYESTFISAGPTTAITMKLSPLSLIEIRGWKEFQRQSGRKIQEYSNMTMNVRYYF
ncbi:MAG: hypothetical protein M0R68_11925 [Bacteroidetes bacterium]|nr:hypothetical protein [Bacteroidota bacterium]